MMRVLIMSRAIRSQSMTLRVFLFILLTFSSLQIYSDESDIVVTVLNPVGFMAPGTHEDIILEIFNPAGSGVTILEASGSGFRPPSQRTQQRDPSRSLAMFTRISYSGASDACTIRGPCLLEGQYPIAPGESVRQVYIQVQVPVDEPTVRELLWSNARVSIRTNSRRERINYYLHTDILRVVTANGEGSPDYFDNVELRHGNGGIVQANLAATFDYPQQLNAGENFTVDVELTNDGSEALRIMQGAYLHFEDIDEGLMLGSSFRFIACEQQCRKSPRNDPYLAPGDTMSLEVGTFVYQHEYLINSELTLDKLSLRVMDQLQRNEQIIVDHAPLHISIRAPGGIESLNTAMQIPNRLPLEVRELIGIENFKLVFDPNANREWLQLSAGESFSIEEIETAMRSGGPLDGFRFAFADEVESLILNHVHSEGIQLQPETLYSFLEDDANVSIGQFIRLMGPTPSVNSGLRTIGIVADSAPYSGTSSTLYTAIELASRGTGLLISGGDGVVKRVVSPDGGIYNYVGYWLVRQL